MKISHDYFFFSIFRSINLATGQFYFVSFFFLLFYTMGSVRQFLGLGIIFRQREKNSNNNRLKLARIQIIYLLWILPLASGT